MKHLRYLSLVLAAGVVLPLASCDKIKDLASKVKGMISSDDDEDSLATDVKTVSEEEGKKIIAEEERMVIVDFYSDT